MKNVTIRARHALMIAHKMTVPAVQMTLIERKIATINAYASQVIMMMEPLCVNNVTLLVNSVLMGPQTDVLNV